MLQIAEHQLLVCDSQMWKKIVIGAWSWPSLQNPQTSLITFDETNKKDQKHDDICTQTGRWHLRGHKKYSSHSWH